MQPPALQEQFNSASAKLSGQGSPRDQQVGVGIASPNPHALTRHRRHPKAHEPSGRVPTPSAMKARPLEDDLYPSLGPTPDSATPPSTLELRGEKLSGLGVIQKPAAASDGSTGPAAPS